MLKGFRSRNHRQQVLLRGPDTLVDDRATEPEFFERLNSEFRFSIDVAATAENAKCKRFFSIEEDGLLQPWSGERVWCNPPYSSIEPWIRKAWAESHFAPIVVMLLPANRTEQGWWQELVEPYRDRDAGLRVRFLSGRLRFLSPGDSSIKPNSRPPFGCCLLIWEAA